jgi:hypothetical protein
LFACIAVADMIGTGTPIGLATPGSTPSVGYQSTDADAGRS